MTSSSAPAATDINLQQGLHQDGRRLTPQRKRVLELFEHCGSGCHLSAEEVHQQLVALEMKVSLATVYRTLRLLADMGLLQELELSEGGRRFELAVDDQAIIDPDLCCAPRDIAQARRGEPLGLKERPADRFIREGLEVNRPMTRWGEVIDDHRAECRSLRGHRVLGLARLTAGQADAEEHNPTEHVIQLGQRLDRLSTR